MRDILFMVVKYLSFHKVKTTILVLSVSLILYLPTGLKVVVEQSAESLTLRAEATPLILGAKGSPLELVLNSLYFDSEVPETMSYGEYGRISRYDLALAIPLNARFRAGPFPIIGTTLDYFDYRNLDLAEGRNISFLGDCVLGETAARKMGVQVGDYVMSSPENVFNLAGEYPLKMHVAGVLKASGSPDDEAVFVDIKTTWIIEGLAHGHQDLSRPEAAAGVLMQEGNVVVGNASVKQYNEITPENIGSFHFHGDPEGFPITAIIAVPNDERSSTLLRGKYLGDEEYVQILKPVEVMSELLETIISVKNYIVVAMIIVGLSTLATMVLVFLLSLRIRQREIQTMHKIGGAMGRIVAILASEILAVLIIGTIISLVLTLLTAQFGPAILGRILLG
jgi:putative ABC transport system permease protein